MESSPTMNLVLKSIALHVPNGDLCSELIHFPLNLGLSVSLGKGEGRGDKRAYHLVRCKR